MIDSSPPERGRADVGHQTTRQIRIYPLLRGADLEKPEDADVLYDLSLLTKGRLLDFLFGERGVRFIPSYEGQTYYVDSQECYQTDSSLLAKGRPGYNIHSKPGFRFIPSYEGQIPASRKSTIHPFLRRADGLNLQKARICIEPSLPAKGRQRVIDLVVMPRGFIPSCEGQALLYMLPASPRMIHPLLRRADRTRTMCACARLDSSLPAKGRRVLCPHRLTPRGFIPSCEGQTSYLFCLISPV